MDINEIRKKLYANLLMEAPEDEESADEAPEDDAEDAEDVDAEEGGDALFSDEEVEAAGGAAAGEDDDTEGSEDETDGQETYASDREKVQALFKDTGVPEKDYSLTNESNIRLAKFKFKNAGIDPITLMTEQEKQDGVRADELESRLSPDEYEVYVSSNRDLRREFKEIEEREKNIIIYNSNIPMFYNDDNGKSKRITHQKDQKLAIDRVREYMNRVFEGHWVDSKKAIEFLGRIKINFSEDPKIRPNLIASRYFEESDDRTFSTFNLISIATPKSIQKFIEDNQENSDLLKSSVFRTLVNDYVGNGVGSSMSSVYVVLRDDSGSEGSEDDDEENVSEEGSEGEGGGLGGDFGGEEDLGDETGDEAGADEGDTEEEGGEDLGF